MLEIFSTNVSCLLGLVVETCVMLNVLQLRELMVFCDLAPPSVSE